MVSSAAQSAALLVDGEVHNELAALGENAAEHSAFAEIIANLAEFRDSWPKVQYIYTMRQLPDSAESGNVAFVVDASNEFDSNDNGIIEDDEMIADPAEPYDASDLPMLHRGFTERSADEEPASDQWGTWQRLRADLGRPGPAHRQPGGYRHPRRTARRHAPEFPPGHYHGGELSIAFIAAGWLWRSASSGRWNPCTGG